MDLSNSAISEDYSLHDKDSSGDSKSSLDSGISFEAINFNKNRTKNSFSSEEFLRKMSVLQNLAKQEEQLKIAIMYEKLRKQQPVLLHTDLLQEKIAEHKKLLQEARSEQKMKNLMCTNLQLANTLQRIAGFSYKTTEANKKNHFSEARRRILKELLKKKKALSKMISTKRQEIAEVDEHVIKLKKHILSEQKRNDETINESSICDNNPKSRHKELKRLTQNNEKLCNRVRLLSKIIHSLVPHLAKHQKDTSLSKLMLECEKITSCQFNNVNDINKLLENVCSVNF